MSRLLLAAILVCLPVTACAQHAGHLDSAKMNAHHHKASPAGPLDRQPAEAGQSAFAAIQEIVTLLENNPDTDWSKVDVEALRQHLIDMANVTLRAQVTAASIKGGARFVITGKAGVVDSIQRMGMAHVNAMNGVDNWVFSAIERPDGVAMEVTATEPDATEKIRALGFIGVMTRGMHHQQHHLMIAKGGSPHHH